MLGFASRLDKAAVPARAPLDKREVRGPVPATGGEPLSVDLRAPLETRLGADFSTVRIHTSARAGASALALNARAYTLGPDIVFAPGHFAPGTAAGRELLAHELQHVKQDGARRPDAGETVSIDPPDSAAEIEAKGVAQAATSGAAPDVSAKVGRDPHGASGARLHRSLLGAGIGAVLGGVGLGLLGSVFGPVGAVVGAIAGTVAGAVIGDIASRRTRNLTSDEKLYLREIYHDAVDFDRVTITRGSAAATGAARTLGNTINLQDEHFKGDTMELSDAGLLVLAHETGHVWQYQNGGLAYIPSSLIPQARAMITGASRNLAYDWRDAIKKKVEFADWNAEQQAECMSDYNEALRRINGGKPSLADYQTVTLAQPYVELVRQRIGAPGSSRRRPPAPASAGATP